MSENADQIIEAAAAIAIKSQRLQNEIRTGQISTGFRETLRFGALSKLIKDLSEDTGKGELECAITIMSGDKSYSKTISLADTQIDTFLGLIEKKISEVRSE